VVLPSTLVEEFEKIAQPNTDLPPYGIETCGILAGKLVSRVVVAAFSTFRDFCQTLLCPVFFGLSHSAAM